MNLQKTFKFPIWGITFLTIGSIGVGAKIYFRDIQHLRILVGDLTFRELLLNKEFIVVEDSSDSDLVKSILIQDLDPIETRKLYPKHWLSEDSSFIAITSKNNVIINPEPTATEPQKVRRYSWINMNYPSKLVEQEIKKECKKLLDEIFSHDLLEKVKKFCTIPTIENVLIRNDFEILETDSDEDDEIWKEVIAGGWFSIDADTGVKYWESQNLVKEEDSKKIAGDKGITKVEEVTEEHIAILKRACKISLSKGFRRKNFPLNTDFLKQANGLGEVDEFQETALFCSKPRSARDYIEKTLLRKVKNKVVSGHYCFPPVDKLKDDYVWMTNSPSWGRTFWCGVRELSDYKRI
ncbi:hypothetical protein MHSWG343_08800 [Candidatus Mycoplasma haematohominis]|uniref:Uncharacterized protein n=1 Tax=Candidatus Mycoplasma haematohominis TaxID=1494318 RepID=A0A478FQV9_9MOLU|nr:hypothetical protein MHSWG343_08800 [Candidatus Mycoplasma haemohominis]